VRGPIIGLLFILAPFITDMLIGIVCIAAPFVLGFSDETAALVFFPVMGVGEVGAAFMTAWEPGDYKAGAAPRPGRSEPLSG